MLKKLSEHVIASSEAAESSSSVNVPEEEKHDGVLLFEGSPDGSNEVDAKLFRPLGYGADWSVCCGVSTWVYCSVGVLVDASVLGDVSVGCAVGMIFFLVS